MPKKEDPAQLISQLMSEWGRKGAEAANAKRTPSQRKRLARKGARARWGKKKAA